MSSDVVLKINCLGKEYPRYATRTDAFRTLFFPYKFKSDRFVALQPLTLQIKRKECVGIMGVNGSGKSTLLQLIAGTLMPTCGEIWADGKIASLLELGSWINGSDTGRENIYTAGYVRGLSKEEIEKNIDRIIDFAEIGDFIDQPVNTYSTGMTMRLAFAASIFQEADILLFDEIFAVGDARFAQKCISFLREYIKEKTVLLVSHDISIVTMLCTRGILLDHGKLVADGTPKEITEKYLELCYGEKQPVQVREFPKSEMPEDFRQGGELQVKTHVDAGRAFGEGGAKVIDVSLLSGKNEPYPHVHGGEKVCLQIRALALKDLDLPAVGFVVRSPNGEPVWGDTSTPGALPKLQAGHKMEVRFHFVLPRLSNGTFSIGIAVSTGELLTHHIQEWAHNILTFNVNSDYPLQGAMLGLPMSSIECREID